jgi:hypothetical protein
MQNKAGASAPNSAFTSGPQGLGRARGRSQAGPVSSTSSAVSSRKGSTARLAATSKPASRPTRISAPAIQTAASANPWRALRREPCPCGPPGAPRATPLTPQGPPGPAVGKLAVAPILRPGAMVVAGRRRSPRPSPPPIASPSSPPRRPRPITSVGEWSGGADLEAGDTSAGARTEIIHAGLSAGRAILAPRTSTSASTARFDLSPRATSPLGKGKPAFTSAFSPSASPAFRRKATSTATKGAQQ